MQGRKRAAEKGVSKGGETWLLVEVVALLLLSWLSRGRGCDCGAEGLHEAAERLRGTGTSLRLRS